MAFEQLRFAFSIIFVTTALVIERKKLAPEARKQKRRASEQLTWRYKANYTFPKFSAIIALVVERKKLAPGA